MAPGFSAPDLSSRSGFVAAPVHLRKKCAFDYRFEDSPKAQHDAKTLAQLSVRCTRCVKHTIAPLPAYSHLLYVSSSHLCIPTGNVRQHHLSHPTSRSTGVEQDVGRQEEDGDSPIARAHKTHTHNNTNHDKLHTCVSKRFPKSSLLIKSSCMRPCILCLPGCGLAFIMCRKGSYRNGHAYCV